MDAYTATITGITTGTHIISVRVVDSSGNVGPAAELSYTLSPAQTRSPWGQFSEADLSAILNAMGTEVIIGGVTVKADFRLSARDVNLFSGTVESTGPICRVSCYQLINLGIEHGTMITVRGTTYAVFAINEEASGFARLDLTKDYTP